MKNVLAVMLIVAISAAGTRPVFGASRFSPQAEMVVHMYNFARAPAAVVNGAEQETTRIFAKAGIELRWVECPLPDPLVEAGQICNGPLNTQVFVVSLIKQAVSASTHDNALGFTATLSGRRNHACILYPKIAELASQNAGMISPAHLIGNVIGHELGHLLYGSGEHREGIMQAHWSAETLRRMMQGRVPFTARQAEALRHRLALRRMMDLDSE